MISSPITYEGEDLRTVQSYEQNPALQSAAYWMDDSIQGLKSTIKGFYILAQQHHCCYCNSELLTEHGRAWDVEHIIPRSSHPIFLFTPRNLAVSCIDCNGRKRDKNVLVTDRRSRYPEDGSFFKIIHPHFDEYSDHILVFSEKFYQAKTRKGEETIAICGLGRFSYAYANWDEGLAGNDAIIRTLDALMNAADDEERLQRLANLLIVAQVNVSRSFL